MSNMHATKHSTLDHLTIQEPIIMDLNFAVDENGEVHWIPAELADLWESLPNGASRPERAEYLDYLDDVARGVE